jgi:selenium-dependent xanthine dehydrogenase
MVEFILNGKAISYQGDVERDLLDFLRNDLQLIAAKDGCSGQGACGACTVELDGRARLACAIKMKKLQGARVVTPEGFPPEILRKIAVSLVNEGAVQCGFCTPGIISTVKVLLENDPDPNLASIHRALKPHLCRCTGYKKIETGIQKAAEVLRTGAKTELNKTSGKIGARQPKYEAFETAIGKRKFVDDIFLENMLFAALKFSDHPKAKIISINTGEAEKLDGVHKVFTSADIPGKTNVGLIIDDWPLMIGEGETTHYIGDVIAGVVAESETLARKAIRLIDIEYEVMEPVTDVFKAIDGPRLHPERPNNFETTRFTIGDTEKALNTSTHVTSGHYSTQRVEHAFLEKESAVALPDKAGGIILYSQSQGVYEDRRQVASVLGLEESKVRVILLSNGGGFGGKEDLSIQGHTAMFAYLVDRPVKLTLSRAESIRLHPKRHPVFMDISLAADNSGKLTGLRLSAVGDTGAYASVGMKVMERVAGHAAGGYYIPNVDIEAKTVYTNNIPSGAMRGFGANQVCFALERCIDELCELGGFDPWQFRYDNALIDGLSTSTGQKLEGVGIRACLDALKPYYDSAKISGLACAIKNSGIGNGMIDESTVKITIVTPEKILIEHGWTEMGQGIHTMAVQTFSQETGLSPEIIEVKVDTSAQIRTGMTTSSRGTALLGLAVINACKELNNDLQSNTINALSGKIYRGSFICDWTSKPGVEVENPIIHYSYGYAAQMCVLDEKGNISKFVAAHDAGKIMNPMLFEGQIEGGVHMGIGYAISEHLPMKEGFLVHDHMRKLGVLRAHQTPDIIVKGVEVPDPVGPYGAKGIGEIGLVPTAAAIANAYCAYDGIKRNSLPLKKLKIQNREA